MESTVNGEVTPKKVNYRSVVISYRGSTVENIAGNPNTVEYLKDRYSFGDQKVEVMSIEEFLVSDLTNLCL